MRNAFEFFSENVLKPMRDPTKVLSEDVIKILVPIGLGGAMVFASVNAPVCIAIPLAVFLGESAKVIEKAAIKFVDDTMDPAENNKAKVAEVIKIIESYRAEVKQKILSLSNNEDEMKIIKSLAEGYHPWLSSVESKKLKSQILNSKNHEEVISAILDYLFEQRNYGKGLHTLLLQHLQSKIGISLVTVPEESGQPVNSGSPRATP